VRAQSRFPTVVATLSNVVVAVGVGGALIATAKHAALRASGASVVRADVQSAATVVAELRPYAILVPKDLYEFGGTEFDALARDVDAQLLVVADTIQLPVLSTLLSEAAVRLG
jgi:hypothetical protein